MKKFEFGGDSVDGQKIGASISNNYSQTIKERCNMLFPESQVPNLYRVMFRSEALILKHYASKSIPKLAFKLLDDAGAFKMGAILTYQAPEEGEEDDGNYNLSFTLKEEDVKDADKIIDSHSDSFLAIVGAELYRAMFGHFSSPVALAQMFSNAVDVLIDFLDQNSNDGEEIQLILTGIFTASVSFEDGAKVISIVPGSITKQCVKDDEELSK